MKIAEYKNQFVVLEKLVEKEADERIQFPYYELSFRLLNLNKQPMNWAFQLVVTTQNSNKLVTPDGDLTEDGIAYLNTKIETCIYRTAVKKLEEQDDE